MIACIHAGAKRVRRDDSTLQAVPENWCFPQCRIRARLPVSSARGLGAIRIALSPGSAARAGNFARAEIEIARRSSLAVPSSAVIYEGSGAFLQTVADGRVSTAPVSLGVRTENFVEIVSGIAEGTEIVSRAGTFVADGDRVAAVREERTGGTAP